MANKHHDDSAENDRETVAEASWTPDPNDRRKTAVEGKVALDPDEIILGCSLMGFFLLVLTLIGLVAVLSGCGSPEGAEGVLTAAQSRARMCRRMVVCGAPSGGGQLLTVSECEKNAEGLLLPIGCVNVMEAASCEELLMEKTSPAIADACFPPCQKTTCRDSYAISICSNGETVTYDCDVVCKNKSPSWTRGSCNTSKSLCDCY